QNLKERKHMSKMALGTDISKKKIDTLLTLDKPLKKIFENTPKGFKLLYAWLQSLRVEKDVHICLEATGPYSEPLAEFLFEKGWPGLDGQSQDRPRFRQGPAPAQ